jgi:hypothetical protein
MTTQKEGHKTMALVKRPLVALIAFSSVSALAQMPEVQIEACKVENAPAICQPAQKMCTEAMTNPEANLLVSPAPFIRNCINDAVKADKLDAESVAGHRMMYLNAARQRATSRRK